MPLTLDRVRERPVPHLQISLTCRLRSWLEQEGDGEGVVRWAAVESLWKLARTRRGKDALSRKGADECRDVRVGRLLVDINLFESSTCLGLSVELTKLGISVRATTGNSRVVGKQEVENSGLSRNH
jgi:hypothetical protein